MSLKALRKALKKSAKSKDQFAVGDVLRWTAASRYTYAAIKTPVGWFTTARYGNSFVPQVLDFEGLIEVLSEPGVTDINSAVSWERVTEWPENTVPVLIR